MKLKWYLGKTIFGQILIDIVVTVIFYFLIPTIMSYAPYSIEKNLIGEYAGVSYTVQALFMYVPYILLMVGFLVIYLRSLIKYRNTSTDDLDEQTKKDLSKKLINTPIICYLMKIVSIPTTVFITLMSINIPQLIIIKLIVILGIAFLLNATIIYIFIKNTFRDLIKSLNNTTVFISKRISVRESVFIQFLSITMASICFISILAYSRLIEEIGDNKFEAVSLIMDKCFESTAVADWNEDSVLMEMQQYFSNNSNYNFFVVEPDGSIKTLNWEDERKYPITYARKYIEPNENRIYDVSKETQGVVKILNNSKGKYIFGVVYNIIPMKSLKYFLYTILTLLILNIIVVLYYSSNMSKNVKEVSKAIEKVVSGDEVDYDKKLPITSNDEIGDLVIAFNKILDLEKDQISKIKSSQNALIEQERLASLGQLAGGMAHDINTPISAIIDGIEYLEHNHEYTEREQKMFEVMKISSKKIIDIVASVRNQIRNMSGDENTVFKISEVMSNLKILLHNALQKGKCELNISIAEDVSLKGDMGKLSQIVMNVVMNAVQAYDENGGKIEVSTYKKEENLVIEVKDYAGGIPEKIANGLFKEILTTKGTQGTGFGLYFSESMIKAKFGGDITFNTALGKGTTFYINIPVTKQSEVENTKLNQEGQ